MFSYDVLHYDHSIGLYKQDEKDLKIRELLTELHIEKKKSAAYEEQLKEILKCVEEHMQTLSVKGEAVANKVKELESSENLEFRF